MSGESVLQAVSPLPTDLPNIDPALFVQPVIGLRGPAPGTHAPRILLLYSSVRERSYSRLASEEAARLL
jgi:arsenic resistance protein ArsH